MNREWADYLRSGLRTAGLQQADLARRIGVSESTVTRWVNHGTAPTVERVRAVADALGLPEAEAMVIAGYGTGDTERVVVRTGAGELTTEDLLAELGRRAGVNIAIRTLAGPPTPQHAHEAPDALYLSDGIEDAPHPGGCDTDTG